MKELIKHERFVTSVRQPAQKCARRTHLTPRVRVRDSIGGGSRSGGDVLTETDTVATWPLYSIHVLIWANEEPVAPA
jgi:hypothetical protein